MIKEWLTYLMIQLWRMHLIFVIMFRYISHNFSNTFNIWVSTIFYSKDLLYFRGFFWHGDTIGKGKNRKNKKKWSKNIDKSFLNNLKLTLELAWKNVFLEKKLEYITQPQNFFWMDYQFSQLNINLSFIVNFELELISKMFWTAF